MNAADASMSSSSVESVLVVIAVSDPPIATVGASGEWVDDKATVRRNGYGK